MLKRNLWKNVLKHYKQCLQALYLPGSTADRHTSSINKPWTVSWPNKDKAGTSVWISLHAFYAEEKRKKSYIARKKNKVLRKWCEVKHPNYLVISRFYRYFMKCWQTAVGCVKTATLCLGFLGGKRGPCVYICSSWERPRRDEVNIIIILIIITGNKYM